ncbi:hypothetical protein CFP75_18450 [Amycolatopsis alba DSM 44262]|uniref:Thiaminase-2/PQQC domain-containing protein n=1 Tax=Amycolatopsis alba DSM 44262 TaxID=1125972 RepID=A0A229RSY3_AMYAL|nr:hypothetical protein CFP75_18450 [Amycolatopsis alba DSM 44262]
MIVSEADQGKPGAVADRLTEIMKHIAVDNSFVTKARHGELSDDNLHAIVRLENATLDNVMVPLAQAIARFPNTPVMDYLLDLTQMVRDDKKGISAAGVAYGTQLDEHPGHRLDSAAYTYAGFINWLCLNANSTAIALAVYVDVTLWHYASALLTPILEKHPGLPKEVVDYFAAYQERPNEVLDKSLAVVANGVANGESLQEAVDTVMLIDEHLAAFWRAADL